MKTQLLAVLVVLFCTSHAMFGQEDGTGEVEIRGELKQWHKVSLILDGPFAKETNTAPNPFTDLAYEVKFNHSESGTKFTVPGFFSADGNAAESSADSGRKWQVNFSPSLTGKWSYQIAFYHGKNAALDMDKGKPLEPYHGKQGHFTVTESDKTGTDFRSRGRLEYVGERYLKFAGDNSYFLKAGPDSPETLLAFKDFDNTRANNPKKGPLKSWQPHVTDWQAGDPIWQNSKGKGLIGAINYLSGKGLNSISFLPYNAGGDGDNVWPFIDRNKKLHYDCSKLDQWEIVFSHATAKGLYLHFKLQETEIDDNRGKKNKDGKVPTSLDGGKLGVERRLYCREIIARFGHHLALNWNIGEENTQTTEEIKNMGNYIAKVDPYDHPIVIHTYPNKQDNIYPPLLGKDSPLTGASLQNPWDAVHQRTLKWINKSAQANKPWVVANDEQNRADVGVPPDPGYKGKDNAPVSIHDIRRNTLWGNLMAGGAGVEYYFGYKQAENDLLCEDFRSRDQSWDFCRIALNFFATNHIPIQKMNSANQLVGNPKDQNNQPWCLAQKDAAYLIFVPAKVAYKFTPPNGMQSIAINPETGEALDLKQIQQEKANFDRAIYYSR